MNHTNIMLDLESWGTTPGSVITSIGAVVFDNDTVLDDFYVRICPMSCVNAGLKIDPDTILWWMKQSDEAREEFSKTCVHLEYALKEFTSWCVAGREGEPIMWGNGADFDNVLLTAAYEAVGQTRPWPRWNSRCYRTAKSYRPDIKIDRVGTHHNALDDARSQAEHLIRIHKAMGVTIG